MSKEKEKILLLSKNQLSTTLLSALLEANRKIIVGAPVRSSADLMKSDDFETAGIILIDFQSLGSRALHDLENIIASIKGNVIIFGAPFDEEVITKCLGLGVKGYLLDSDSAEILKLAVESILAGKMAISSVINSCLRENLLLKEYKKSIALLTEREREIMSLVANGLSSREIAETLGIGRRTVEKHRENIKEKLNGKSVAVASFVFDNYLL